MKRSVLIAFLLFSFTIFTHAQSNFHNIHYLDPYNPEYVKGEVLVRFKDEAEVKTAVKSGVALTGIESVDELLQVYQMEAVTKVFNETREQRQRKKVRTIRDFKGKEMEVPALFNIYKLKFDTVWDTKQIIEELQKDKNVEFAEPNYLVYTNEVIESGIVSDQPPTPTPLPTNKGNRNTYPNDPLYQDGSQWYLDAINAPAAWDSVTGDTTQIIAIIDTGVDWDHPDLDDNIWTNWNEIPDNGIDDDGNGYVDDVRGWDYINNDNNPNDDNSHGTHVAGIAAAEGNNGIGICGVAWNAQIMPVKVLQSSGTGNSSDFAQGIEYASDNGATVINMSLGSYGESQVVKTALENAYAGTGDGEGSMLVAAAGNNHKRVGPNPCFTYGYAPMFPASYSWVIGVMAEDAGPCDGFSNWDFDGPIAFDGSNYEIQAKGVGIMSCKPNGGYWSKNGTSMASPEVAGTVALMRQYHPDDSGEQIFAKIIQGANSGLIDIYNALTTTLIPNLFYIDYTIVDTLPGCDRDGVADAGETIQLHMTVKNAGGQADSVWSKIRFGEFEEHSVATILDSISCIGDMSAYSTMNGELDPFRIEIASNIANNRDIVFEYEIGFENYSTLTGGLIITVQKGIEIAGVITSDMTLNTENLYLLTSNFRVSEGVTLTIQPGTKIKFYPGTAIDVRGNIEAIGKPDSLIIFESANSNLPGDGIFFKNQYGNDTSYINYCIFSELSRAISADYLYGNAHLIFCDNIIRFCKYLSETYYSGISISVQNKVDMKRNNFIDNFIDQLSIEGYLNLDKSSIFKDNIVTNNLINKRVSPNSIVVSSEPYYTINTSNKNNSFFNNILFDYYSSFIGGETNLSLFGNASTGIVINNYWGTNDSIHINSTIYDFDYNFNNPACIFTPILAKPSEESHGIVWKIDVNNILINKYDNSYNSATGLGIISAETLKFDVYFNRAMDTSNTPLLTFGVREPYTQHIVADSAHWSSDSTIWTAYTTIDMTTGDGIQRVRVANARDDEYFEIPIEDSRFEFVIQAAAAASIEFYATPGIGKVDLEWPPTPSEDALGYNLYRFYNLTDSTFSDTLMINTELILDTVFTDYNVIPDTTYHYLYKTLGTDMVETDYSKKATATPFNAANGDANGDLAVNVLDITTIVSYMLNQNPSPFLFDAADVNYDDNINVLDIIGLVHLINGTKNSLAQPLPDISQEKAYYLMKDGKLSFESKGNVAALQFKLRPKSQQPTANSQQPIIDQLKIFSLAKGFEFAYGVVDDEVIGILYSMSGKELPEGVMDLFRFEGMDVNDLEVIEIFGGDVSGDYVPVLKKGENSPVLMNGAELQVNPNPFNYATQINYTIPEEGMVTLRLFDLSGAEVKNLVVAYRPTGHYSLNWNGTNGRGQLMEAGIYLLQLKIESVSGEVYRKEVKVVLSK